MIWANMSDSLSMVQMIASWPWHQLPKNIFAQEGSGTTGAQKQYQADSHKATPASCNFLRINKTVSI